MTIKKLLKLTMFGNGMVLLAILVFCISFTVAMREQTEKLVSSDYALLMSLDEMYAQSLQAGQSTRNFILNDRDPVAKTNYEKADSAFTDAVDKALKLSSGKDAENIKKISQLKQENHVLQMKVQESGNRDEAIALLKDKEIPVWREMKGLILSSIADQNKKVQGRLEQNRANSHTQILILIAIITVSLALSVWSSLTLTNKISKRLSVFQGDFDKVAQGDLSVVINDNGKDEISAISKRANEIVRFMDDTVKRLLSVMEIISVVSDTLKNKSANAAKGSRNQSLQAHQIATAAEEMSQTIIDIAQNAGDAAKTANNAMAAASEGKIVSRKTVDTVKQVSMSTGKLSSMIANLNERVKEIDNIVTVINDIADQTNLLALNAAIEAARAGDQGRGFAVVADEVKKLADRTINATSQITTTIRSVQDESDKTMDSMQSSSEVVQQALDYISTLSDSLSKIANDVEVMQGQITQIATAVDEQSATSEEIARNIGETSAISKEVENMSGEVLVEGSSLIVLSEEVKHITDCFHTNSEKSVAFDLAILRHKLFLERIRFSLDGVITLNPSALPDHFTCLFGKWYYTEGKTMCSHLSIFKDIEQPHNKVHALAVEAVTAHNNGEKNLAETKFNEMKKMSEQLIHILGAVKEKHLQHIEDAIVSVRRSV